jgi:CO/xanthine dehydrogenase FAD-binding subunit
MECVGIPQVFIDVTNVPDLNVTSVTPTGLTVGAAVSLAQLIVLCNQQDPMSPLYTNDAKTEAVATATSSFSALARHLLLVATRQVRSVGSWAGNLMLATHYHDFPSDVALVLMSLGVQVTIVQAGTSMTVPVEQVYASATLNTASTIIVSMMIPNLQGVTAAKPGPYVIDSFKAMLRHQNSHALVNAGFLLTLGPGNTVSAARIFYGGVSKQIFRATRTETQIIGNALSQTVLTNALAGLQQDIDNTGPSTYYGTTDAYRRQVASSFLYKLFIRALPPASISARNASAGERYVRPVSSETATYSSDPAEAPVSDPVMKLGALKQVAGEALYTFDEKQERDGLYGALATTQVAAGTITAIDTTAAAAVPGVVRILTVADIPAGGKNDIGPNPGQEKMFLAVGDDVGCIGQSVALVVADTFQHALEASRAVVITVSAPSVAPIFTIADAIAAKSLYPNGTPGRMVPPQGIIKGDASGAMKTAATTVTGTVTVGGQKHMYMEVQNACAKLLEDDTLEVSVSTQSPGLCQYMACNITGMTSNQVNITTRRSGGGYGGKGTRMAPVVASASLAALVMGKQVHVQMERCQDMIMVSAWWVGVILALQFWQMFCVCCTDWWP